MPEEIFMYSNPPINRTIQFEGGTIQLGARCVGAILVWAKKVLSGTDINETDPTNSQSMNASVAARSQQGQRAHQFGLLAAQQDAFYTIRGGLTFEGLFLGTERYVHLPGINILLAMTHYAPPGKVYCLVLREPAQAVGLPAGHAVGIFKATADSFYFFNPNTALYRCNSRQDFFNTARLELAPYLFGLGFGASVVSS